MSDIGSPKSEVRDPTGFPTSASLNTRELLRPGQTSDSDIRPPNSDLLWNTNIEPPNQTELTQSVISTITAAGADATGTNPVEIPAVVQGGTAIAEVLSETAIFAIDAIESYPKFPGGQEAFIKFLRKNLKYPGMAVESGIQGKVILSFIIERSGELSHIKIVRGIGSGCDEEAVRVLSRSPQWEPGIQNNQKVRVAYTLPINFSLAN